MKTSLKRLICDTIEEILEPVIVQKALEGVLENWDFESSLNEWAIDTINNNADIVEEAVRTVADSMTDD